MGETVASTDEFMKLEAAYAHAQGKKSSPKGPSSLLTRQMILHQYSPKVSVISSEAVDKISQQYGYSKFLELLQGFEDHLYGPYSMLGNKVHVKFRPPIDETLRRQNEFKGERRNNVTSSELFEMDALEVYGGTRTARWMNLVNRLAMQTTLAPFEFFNHPVAQVICVSATETIATVKALISDWKYVKYPQWIDANNMLAVFVIVVDSKDPESLQQAVQLQEHLKLQLSYKSVIVVHPEEDAAAGVRLAAPVGSHTAGRHVGAKFKAALNNCVLDLVEKHVVPYMERKMHTWNEEVVNPRRSLTGRFFNASRRWGGSADSGAQAQSYNAQEGFYHVGSNEYVIRRLADWHFMLRDYKRSYTTYELLKKDFLKDKTWSYLASLHEFMIVSLLVGSSQKGGGVGNGITTKIIADLVNPAVDSLQYSYLSRCYLKTYALRASVTVAELFVSLGEANQQFGVNSNNNVYFDESCELFTTLLGSNLVAADSKRLLVARISYVYDVYYLDVRDPAAAAAAAEAAAATAELLPHKAAFCRGDAAIMGLTRRRKSMLWEQIAVQ